MNRKIKNLQIKIEKRTLEEANFIIEKSATLRGTAKELGTSKSTVHKDIRERLIYLDYEKYKLVCNVLELNKDERAMRGGLATKEKYLNIKKRNY